MLESPELLTTMLFPGEGGPWGQLGGLGDPHGPMLLCRVFCRAQEQCGQQAPWLLPEQKVGLGVT